jgi:hypothetical protein
MDAPAVGQPQLVLGMQYRPTAVDLPRHLAGPVRRKCNGSVMRVMLCSGYCYEYR